MCLNCSFEHLYWYPSRNLLSTVYLNSRWEFCSLFVLKLQNSWYKKFIRLPAAVSGRLWHNATGAGCTSRKEGMKANRCEGGHRCHGNQASACALVELWDSSVPFHLPALNAVLAYLRDTLMESQCHTPPSQLSLEGKLLYSQNLTLYL